jgi:ubiquinone/menaquinone biosynthesis C-methylase UbiE
MTACTRPRHTAGAAFDGIAEQYDDLFTRSLIGRAQRDAVWNVLQRTFRAGERVLELNCGTGEDAVFLGQMGVSVLACDASEGMVAVAARRMTRESRDARVQLQVCATEDLDTLREVGLFDGVLSNFSGLNCVLDLTAVARTLARMVRPGGRVVLCMSSRFCLWEALWYTAHVDLPRAFRRWRGHSKGSLGRIDIDVRYPTRKEICRSFSPQFALKHFRGVGITVPPSYVEHVARKYPKALRTLRRVDQAIATWPVCRSVGDHELLVLERTRL